MKISGFKKKFFFTDTFCNACIQKYQNRKPSGKILILSQFAKPSANPHRAGNDQNRTFLIRIMILGGFRFELLDRAPGQFLSISTWLVNYTILTIGIGFAERCRIVKETRRGSFLIRYSPLSTALPQS